MYLPVFLISSSCFPQETNHNVYSTKYTSVDYLPELKLLPEHHMFMQLGLSFCPTPKFVELVNICNDDEQFRRRLRQHEYFLSNGDANK